MVLTLTLLVDIFPSNFQHLLSIHPDRRLKKENWIISSADVPILVTRGLRCLKSILVLFLLFYNYFFSFSLYRVSSYHIFGYRGT